MDDVGRIDGGIRRGCGPRDLAIAKLAARQHGVVARGQLVRLGVGPHAIDHRVRAGKLHSLNAGVYAVGHRALGGRARLMAAVLACGPGAVLSHTSAAALWELRPSSRAAADVTTQSRGRRSRPGITIHRVRHLHSDDHTVRDGIPVTTVARTLLDLAEVLRPRQLQRAFDEAERQRLLDLHAIEELTARSQGRRGLKPLTSLLNAAVDEPPPTRSELERSFLDLCHDQDLPTPAINSLVAGFEVDAAWPQHRLAVELDSRAFHLTRKTFERDRIRDAELQLAGYRVIRITHRRLTTQPEAVVDTLRALLRPTLHERA